MNRGMNSTNNGSFYNKGLGKNKDQRDLNEERENKCELVNSLYKEKI